MTDPAAVEHTVSQLRNEYGRLDILVNSARLAQAPTNTVRLEAEAIGADAAQLLEQQGRAIPVGRYGTAADLGAMVVWIASDQSSFTTGASFNLTGGTSVFF